jgi:DNA-binding transcriptional ArsR family regulator
MSDSARAAAILHPTRVRIVFVLQGRQLTAQQIGHLLGDVPPATLYRHLKVLIEADVVAVVQERRVHGTLERLLTVADARLSDDDRKVLTAETIEGLVASVTAIVHEAFGRYVRTKPMPPPAGELAFLSEAVYLTDAEYAQLRQEMIGLLERGRQGPGGGRRRRLLAYFAVPDALPEIIEES